MRKCVHACMHTYIHYMGEGVAHDNGIFAFSNPSSFLFLFPCLPTSAFLLGYPSLLLGREWWPADKQPSPSSVPPPFPLPPWLPYPRVLPSFPYIVYVP